MTTTPPNEKESSAAQVGALGTIGKPQELGALTPEQEMVLAAAACRIGIDEYQKAASAARHESTSYWMIERQVPYHYEWWVRGMGRDDGTMAFEEWTTDASKAQHFNKWGAEHHAQELSAWGVVGTLIATEHIDCTEPETHPQAATPSDSDGHVVVRATIQGPKCPNCGQIQDWCICMPPASAAGPTPPYANCSFKYCDIPGQCKAEGKCHHPAPAAVPDTPTPRTDAYCQEFWWLIETQRAFSGTGKPGYATGDKKRYGFEWTLDPYKAMRFATQEAAATVRTQYRLWDMDLGGYLDCEAVEHGFISASERELSQCREELREADERIDQIDEETKMADDWKLKYETERKARETAEDSFAVEQRALIRCEHRAEAAERRVEELTAAFGYLLGSTRPRGQWADQAVHSFVQAALAKQEKPHD